LLDEALACMVCHIDQQVEAGDHTLFIASVEDIEVRQGDALVFYEGGYKSARCEQP
jgi:flavin reductase (DIM6/NTAB) family NADH-FMN oxidoreductase RutF